MFYEFDDEIVVINPQEIDGQKLCVGFLSFSEFEKTAPLIGISLSEVELCSKKSKNKVTKRISDDSIFIKISDDDFAVAIRKNLFVVIDVSSNGKNNRSFMELLSQCPRESATLEKAVTAFFEIKASDSFLNDEEEDMEKLEKTVMDGVIKPDFPVLLIRKKQELLHLRAFYERLAEVSEIFIENKNEIFDPVPGNSFELLRDKILRLRGNIDILRDSIMHLWDAYQASIALKQNETMKLFTVITSVFMPMTVIVGWYGMNFDMPEYASKAGYPFVIVLNIIVVVLLLIIFRKKKWI